MVNGTKHGILEALKRRRVYATSGAPILITFRINDHSMGDSLSTEAIPTISLDVEGTSALQYVKIVRNNEEILTLGKDIKEGRGVRTTFKDKTISPGHFWYYLRVLQEDGEMAWSSPIWVNYTPPAMPKGRGKRQ